MPALFAITLFVSAFLLFLVQPMMGRMILPKLGGTPAVWNACMVFFQAVLLAGYGYAHASTAWLGSRRQAMIHFLVLLLPLLVLPVLISDDSFRGTGSSDNPIGLVLMLLTTSIGLPFFVVSTTGPLLQRWYADTGHPSAKDPYFLYAASNVGSLLALIAYPLLVEPQLLLVSQSNLWAWGYGVYAVLVVCCGLALNRSSLATQVEEASTPIPAPSLTWTRKLSWVFLAFVPSTLLLGATTYVSTDIAPIPLLWIVPLSLYLLSFILVFSKKQLIPHAVSTKLLPICILLLTMVLSTGATELKGLPLWPLLFLHLATFFFTSMVGHGEMALDRPAACQLTEFYLWMSVGGVLGGLFNALLSPILFQHTGLTEYPVAIVLACFLQLPAVLARQSKDSKTRSNAIYKDIAWPVGVGMFAAAFIVLSGRMGLEAGPLRTGLSFGLPCLVAYTFVGNPLRYGLGIAAIFLAGAINPDQKLLHLERNFFGVVKVADITSPEGVRFRALFHGTTVHGQVSLENKDDDGRHEPSTYYHKTGPIGEFSSGWIKSRPKGQRVAGVGLGTGSLAYYARSGDEWTFYEIDPAMQRVAENPQYFPFMSECRAGVPKVILGDARLKLHDAADSSIDLLILDAFSSDSIPMHLMTRQAFALYKRKLKDDGAITLHVSNRYLDLWPIAAKLAEDAGLVIWGRHDRASGESQKMGKYTSQWLILAHREQDLFPEGGSLDRSRWESVKSNPNTPLWTDDFSNLLSAFGQRE